MMEPARVVNLDALRSILLVEPEARLFLRLA